MRRDARGAAALAVSAAVSAAGWRSGALRTDGALSSTALGATILDRLSWRGGVVLGVFFVSSSALSRVARGHDVAARGSRRDIVQVLANGGVAGAAALASSLIGERGALTMAAGSLAAATADTWATEIGSTSPDVPRMLVSRRPAPPGTSGAVTARGLSGAIAGAVLLGTVTYAVRRPTSGRVRSAVAVAVAGVTGSLVDSLLGEMVQERRWCERCQKATEARVHRCGERTTMTGGVPGVTNDVVNIACTVVGAVVSAMLASTRSGHRHTPPVWGRNSDTPKRQITTESPG